MGSSCSNAILEPETEMKSHLSIKTKNYIIKWLDNLDDEFNDEFDDDSENIKNNND